MHKVEGVQAAPPRPGLHSESESAAADGPVSEPYQTLVWRSPNLGLSTELPVSRPEDRQEKDAERMASRVEHYARLGSGNPAGMPSDLRPPAAGLRRTAANSVGSIVPSNSGQPLEEHTRAALEPLFGAAFSEVRIHTDAAAAQASDRLAAKAFTVGPHISFGAGQYQPRTNRGQQLIAHELTHVVQARDPAANSRVQRDVIETNPVLIKAGDTTAQGERRQNISNGAIATLPIWASNYANLWLTAGTTALAGVPEPDDAAARQNWWIALAGNLTWAATSLLAPEATVAIRVMSFGGAAAGSGVLASGTAPSGKGLVGLQLARARDAMVRAAGPLVIEVAVDCGFGLVEDIEKQKQRLWNRMLPGVPYEQSEAITASMQAGIAAGLHQFLEQWKAWESGDEGATPEKLGAALKKRSWFEDLVAQPGDTFILMEQLRQQWKADHPFKPILTF